MGDVWPIVHAERAALIDDLSALDDLWAYPSLCGKWTVHDVAAHLVNNAKTTRLGLVRDMVRARFDFDRQNAQGVVRERGTTTEETLARLRQVATRTSAPPAPLDSRLVEEVVHGEDIRHRWASSASTRRRRSSSRCGIRRAHQWSSGVRSNSSAASGWRPRTKTCRSVTVPGSRWPGCARAGVADCWEPGRARRTAPDPVRAGMSKRRPRPPSTRCRKRIPFRSRPQRPGEQSRSRCLEVSLPAG